jgi:transcriptional regulator with XRE-family HTH domain
MTMDRRLIVFGTELRRRRTQSGLSLADLSRLVHYSKSHLSKVENGLKPPSIDLARRCDAAIGCDGALAGLAPRPVVDVDIQPDADVGEVWVLTLGAEGDSGFRSVSRRELITGGVAGVAAWAGLPHPLSGPDPTAAGKLAAFRAIFDELRALGQQVAPAALMPALVGQTHALRALAGAAAANERPALLLLAARYAEYTGWMAQEAGDDSGAAWWTGRAVDLAEAGGDPEMAAYALVRRALISLYQQDAVQTVELARLARSTATHPRIRSLASLREAQGHALAGDYDACFRALERAGGTVPGDAAPSAPVIGTSQVPDPVATATGWCLLDLGRPVPAAEILRRELDRIPPTALRARARYGARLALALAAAGEPEEACRQAGPVLEACERIDSATVRAELRHLNRALGRWHAVPLVRDTRLRLARTLHR